MTINKRVTTPSSSCPKHFFEFNLLDIFAFYHAGVDSFIRQSIFILESMKINGNKGLVPHKLFDFDVQIFQSLFFNHTLNNICIIFISSWLILTWSTPHDGHTRHKAPLNTPISSYLICSIFFVIHVLIPCSYGTMYNI
jgi:hypothetical protein